MKGDVQKLEAEWLHAEEIADQFRLEAKEKERAIESLTTVRDRNGSEVTVLLSEAEDLHARHRAAEQAAELAFERLWKARGEGEAHA